MWGGGASFMALSFSPLDGWLGALEIACFINCGLLDLQTQTSPKQAHQPCPPLYAHPNASARATRLPDTLAHACPRRHRAHAHPREFEAACRAVGVPDGLHSGEARRQLLDRLWRAPRPAAAGAAAAAAAAAVAGALKYAQPEALCAAQQRGTGDFLAAAGLALRDAALG